MPDTFEIIESRRGLLCRFEDEIVLIEPWGT